MIPLDVTLLFLFTKSQCVELSLKPRLWTNLTMRYVQQSNIK